MARSETGTASGTSTGTGGAQAPGSKSAASSTACTEGESSVLRRERSAKKRSSSGTRR